ncbi:MAG: bifunctional folylpolyglutamate synthase/dihydrofolate synthase [Clostridia bacterium]|nr:bifunctional folylpolyglutamate synthase/dihydrofolate synthase [Clostridia bacterium]
MTYQETLAWLHSMPRTHKKPTLDRIRTLLDALGSPHDALAGRFIHVTGTNGKGSVCAMITSALQAQGYRVGRFISPFIMEFRERIEINGACISEEELSALADRIRPVVNRYTQETDDAPLEFELVVLLGLLWFAEQECDLVVLEVGIGGMHDPTNVVVPCVSVITHVDYDHTELLGDTLEKIARIKSGIVKTGAPCILAADNPEEVQRTVAERCRSCGVSMTVPDTPKPLLLRPGHTELEYRGTRFVLQLSGLYQLRNAAAAIEALRAVRSMGIEVSEEAIARGLGDTSFPARFEMLSDDPPVLLDGAHNASGMDALAENLRTYYPDTPVLLLCGMLTDKNPDEVLARVLHAVPVLSCACITPPSPRAMPGEALCALVQASGIDAHAYADIPTALQALYRRRAAAKQTVMGALPIICFGSLYSAGDVRRALGRFSESAEVNV